MADEVQAGKVAIVFEAQNLDKAEQAFNASMAKLESSAAASAKKISQQINAALTGVSAVGAAPGQVQEINIPVKLGVTKTAIGDLIGDIQRGLNAHTFQIKIAPVMPGASASGAVYQSAIPGAVYPAMLGNQVAGVPAGMMSRTYQVGPQPRSSYVPPGRPVIPLAPAQPQMPLPLSAGYGAQEMLGQGNLFYQEHRPASGTLPGMHNIPWGTQPTEVQRRMQRAAQWATINALARRIGTPYSSVGPYGIEGSSAQANLFSAMPRTSQMGLPGMADVPLYGTHPAGNRGYVPRSSYVPNTPGFTAPYFAYGDDRRNINNQSARARMAMQDWRDNHSGYDYQPDRNVLSQVRSRVSGQQTGGMGLGATAFNPMDAQLRNEFREIASKHLVNPLRGFVQRIGKGWEDAIQDAERKALRNFMTGAVLTGTFTAPAMMAARATIGLTNEYDSKMRQITGLTEIGPRQLPLVNRQIGSVVRETGLTPAQLADAYYYIASTGNNAQASGTIMRTSGRMSVAGMGRPNILADTLTTALQVYGEPASKAPRYGNVLAEAVALGKGEANLYAPAAGKVMAAAKLAGISFPEVMANIATASRAGIKPNQAGTALNMLLENLRDPSQESGRTMKAIGTSPEEVIGKLRNPKEGLLSTLKFLFDKAGQNDAIMSKMVGSVTGLRNALSTAGAQTEAYTEILGKLNGATNRVDHAFGQMAQVAEFQWNRVVSSAQMAAIELTQKVMPSITKSLEATATRMPEQIGRITAAWDALPAPVKAAIGVGGGALVAAGPIAMGLGISSMIKPAAMNAGLMLARNPLPFMAAYAGAGRLNNLVGGGDDRMFDMWRDTPLMLAGGLMGMRAGQSVARWWPGRREALAAGPLGGIGAFWNLARGNSPAGVPVGSQTGFLNAARLVGGPGVLGLAGIAGVGIAGGAAMIGTQLYRDRMAQLSVRQGNVAARSNVLEGLFDSGEAYAQPALGRPDQWFRGRTNAAELMSGLRADFSSVSDAQGLGAFRAKVDRAIRDIESKKIKLDVDDTDGEGLLRVLKKLRDEATPTVNSINEVGKSLADFYKQLEKTQESSLWDTFKTNLEQLGETGSTFAGVWRTVADSLSAVEKSLDRTARKTANGDILGAAKEFLTGPLGGADAMVWNAGQKALDWVGRSDVGFVGFGLGPAVPAARPATPVSPGGSSAPTTTPGILPGILAPSKVRYTAEQLLGFGESAERIWGHGDELDRNPARLKQLYKDFTEKRAKGWFGPRRGENQDTVSREKERYYNSVLEPKYRALLRQEKENPPVTGVLPDDAANKRAERMARDLMQEKKASWQSYAGLVGGMDSTISLYAKETEVARTQNELLKSSFDHITDSARGTALALAGIIDKLKGISEVNAASRATMGSQQEALIRAGIYNNPLAKGAARVSEIIGYQGMRDRLQSQGAAIAGPAIKGAQGRINYYDDLLASGEPLAGLVKSNAVAPLIGNWVKGVGETEGFEGGAIEHYLGGSLGVKKFKEWGVPLTADLAMGREGGDFALRKPYKNWRSLLSHMGKIVGVQPNVEVIKNTDVLNIAGQALSAHKGNPRGKIRLSPDVIAGLQMWAKGVRGGMAVRGVNVAAHELFHVLSSEKTGYKGYWKPVEEGMADYMATKFMNKHAGIGGGAHAWGHGYPGYLGAMRKLSGLIGEKRLLEIYSDKKDDKAQIESELRRKFQEEHGRSFEENQHMQGMVRHADGLAPSSMKVKAQSREMAARHAEGVATLQGEVKWFANRAMIMRRQGNAPGEARYWHIVAQKKAELRGEDPYRTDWVPPHKRAHNHPALAGAKKPGSSLNPNEQIQVFTDIRALIGEPGPSPMPGNEHQQQVWLKWSNAETLIKTQQQKGVAATRQLIKRELQNAKDTDYALSGVRGAMSAFGLVREQQSQRQMIGKEHDAVAVMSNRLWNDSFNGTRYSPEDRNRLLWEAAQTQQGKWADADAETRRVAQLQAGVPAAIGLMLERGSSPEEIAVAEARLSVRASMLSDRGFFHRYSTADKKNARTALNSAQNEAADSVKQSQRNAALSGYNATMSDMAFEGGMLDDEISLRQKFPGLSDSEIADKLAGSRAYHETLRRLTYGKPQNATKSDIAKAERARSTAELLSSQRSQASDTAAGNASTRQSDFMATFYANDIDQMVQGEPGSLQYEMQRQQADASYSILSDFERIRNPITRGLLAQNARNEIATRYGYQAREDFRMATSDSGIRRAALGDSQVAALLQMRRRFGGSANGRLDERMAMEMGDAHAETMYGYQRSQATAYARNPVSALGIEMGLQRKLFAANGLPVDDLARQHGMQLSAAHGLQSAQTGAAFVQGSEGRMLAMREEVLLLSKVREVDKDRVRLAMELERYRAQGIQLSEQDLKNITQTAEEESKRAEKFRNASRVAGAFNQGFDAMWSGFGRDTGKFDRQGRYLSENQRYLAQVRSFTAQGIEPGNPIYDRASARHDIMMGDISRTKPKGNWLGNAARDLLAPAWDLVNSQIRDTAKDWVMERSGLSGWLGSQTSPLGGGTAGQVQDAVHQSVRDITGLLGGSSKSVLDMLGMGSSQTAAQAITATVQAQTAVINIVSASITSSNIGGLGGGNLNPGFTPGFADSLSSVWGSVGRIFGTGNGAGEKRGPSVAQEMGQAFALVSGMTGF